MLALPGVQLLDVAGPLDVFSEANVQSGYKAYETCVIGLSRDPVISSSGVRLLPDQMIDKVAQTFDTLLVAGAPHLSPVKMDPRLLQWLRTHAPRCRRYGSVCSGALFLAASGLISGKKITTHWAIADDLRSHFPDVVLEIDAMHVRDGKVCTAAGVTAGLDLALALVEEDLGREVAKKVASQLVMFFKRPGGQLQFSRSHGTSPAGRSILQEIQRWVISNPEENITTATLASRANLSTRHFVRLFQEEMGITPSIWIRTVRIDHARKMLEAGKRPKEVCAAVGFSDIDTFRRAFQHLVGVTPSEYSRCYER